MGPQFIPEPFSSITIYTLVGDHAKISGKAPVMLKVYYNITSMSYHLYRSMLYNCVWQLQGVYSKTLLCTNAPKPAAHE